MADPTPYERTYSFTDFQAGNPSAPLPGIQVDNELENVEQSLGEAIDAIKDVRRSDGALKNEIVTLDTLDPTVRAGVGAGALAAAAAAAASAEAASDSADAAADSEVAADAAAAAAMDLVGLAATALQPTTGLYRVATFANAGTDYIPAPVMTVYVEDRGARFSVVGSEPAHALKFQNSLQWWEIDEDFITPAMAGTGDGGWQGAFNNAITAAALRGGEGRGSTVLVPNLGFDYVVTGSVVIKSRITLKGIGQPTIKLADGANTDVIVSENFYSLTGSNTSGGVTRFVMEGLLIDGNRANQTASDPETCSGVAIYGFAYCLRDIFIGNSLGHGLRLEWGSDAGPLFGMESDFHHIKVDRSGRHGIWFKGPHDSDFNNIIVIDASQEADGTYDGICVEGQGNGRYYNIHPWHRSGTTNRMRYAFSGGSGEIVNSHLEGGRAQLWARGGLRVSNTLIYAPSSNADQIVIDGEGNDIRAAFMSNTSFPKPSVVALGRNVVAGFNRVMLNVSLRGGAAGGDVVNFVSEIGPNIVDILAVNADTTRMISGTPDAYSSLLIRQDSPSRYSLDLRAQTGHTVQYAGWNGQKSRYGTLAGAMSISYNAAYNGALTTVTQDDAAAASMGIVGVAGSIVFLAEPAGSTSAQKRGELTSAGTWRFGGVGGAERLTVSMTGIGFYGTAPQSKPTITGSRGSNAALADLLTKLAALGLITDSTT